MELPNTLVVLRPVQAFVREIFFAHGFGQREVEEVEVALEEALVNGVEHAYGPGGEGPLRVTVAPHPLGLAVVVHDDGLPLDYGALEKNVPDPSVSGLGVGHLLMRRLVDEFRLVNRGRGGKDVEMVKYLPCPQASFGDAPPDEGRDEGSRGPSEAAAPPRDQPMTLRSFRPEDALEVARCAWYAYGYSYAHDHVLSFSPSAWWSSTPEGSSCPWWRRPPAEKWRGTPPQYFRIKIPPGRRSAWPSSNPPSPPGDCSRPSRRSWSGGWANGGFRASTSRR